MTAQTIFLPFPPVSELLMDAGGIRCAFSLRFWARPPTIEKKTENLPPCPQVHRCAASAGETSCSRRQRRCAGTVRPRRAAPESITPPAAILRKVLRFILLKDSARDDPPGETAPDAPRPGCSCPGRPCRQVPVQTGGLPAPSRRGSSFHCRNGGRVAGSFLTDGTLQPFRPE